MYIVFLLLHPDFA